MVVKCLSLSADSGLTGLGLLGCSSPCFAPLSNGDEKSSTSVQGLSHGFGEIKDRAWLVVAAVRMHSGHFSPAEVGWF